MSDLTQQALRRLQAIGTISSADVPSIMHVIASYEAAGWTVDEVVDYMQWREEVNPEVSEDRALARMRVVRQRVERRLRAS